MNAHGVAHRLTQPHHTSHASRPHLNSRITPLRPLLLIRLSSLPNPLQNLLSILIRLQLCHDDLARVHANRDRLPIALLAAHALDVDEVLEAVDGGDFAFAALVGAADDGDFVVFADGDGSDLLHFRHLDGLEVGYLYVVLFSEFFAERGGHDVASCGGLGAEVKFAGLAPR
jgi:hypothetical protein